MFCSNTVRETVLTIFLARQFIVTVKPTRENKSLKKYTGQPITILYYIHFKTVLSFCYSFDILIVIVNLKIIKKLNLKSTTKVIKSDLITYSSIPYWLSLELLQPRSSNAWHNTIVCCNNGSTVPRLPKVVRKLSESVQITSFLSPPGVLSVDELDTCLLYTSRCV